MSRGRNMGGAVSLELGECSAEEAKAALLRQLRGAIEHGGCLDADEHAQLPAAALADFDVDRLVESASTRRILALRPTLGGA